MREAQTLFIPDPSQRPDRAPRRHASPVPFRRIVGRVALSAVLFTLTVLVGPHLQEHLRSTGGDPDHCAVCVWTHGTRASAPTAPPTLVAALPIAGGLTADRPLGEPTPSHLSSPSRAPPTIE